MQTFSVLMSVYYKEKGDNLDRALKSIWSDQTLRPNQIILVQDGKLTDELLKVIDKYENICGDIFCSPILETNSGLAKALNKGLKYVTSDLVARMDSDDISSFDRFEKQVKFMDNNLNIDISSGSIQEFSDNNPCICVRSYPKINIKEYICKASPLAHASSIMRMRIFNEGGLAYDTSYPLNEDIKLWFDAIRKGFSISNIDDIIYFVRSDEGLISRRSKVKAKYEFFIYMKGIKDLFGLFTWRYIYPITRFFFRLMPTSIIKFFYSSKLRFLILNGKK